MKKRVNIYGGGPSALILAHQLLGIPNLEIHIYEKTKRVGSKFLVAGKGGFNLSHDMGISELMDQYRPYGFMNQCLESFPPTALRKWLKNLNIETFTGSSNRIFPVKGIKPIDVLNKILDPLNQSVKIHYESEVVMIQKSQIHIKSIETKTKVQADYHVFALGGASWAKTGSDGAWKSLFEDKNITVIKFGQSNCGLTINWSNEFVKKYSGTPLKNISIRLENRKILGEALITNYGIEGNAIYPIASDIAKILAKQNQPTIFIDFKPQVSKEKLLSKFSKTKGNTSNRLRELGVSTVGIALLKLRFTREDWTLGIPVVHVIKNLDFEVEGLPSIEDSISTTGGIDLREVNENFELKKLPNHYAIGEMLDWDTITGGFLLQGCFSMGVAVGQNIKSKLTKNRI